MSLAKAEIKTEFDKGPCNFSALAEQLHSNIQSTVENVLGPASYDTNEVPNWVDTITTGTEWF